MPALKPAPAQGFIETALTNWLGAAGFLVAISFFLQTHDSAQIKTVLLRCAAVGALALWVCLLYIKRQNIFTKENLLKLLPFVLYFVYVILSYIFKPYSLGRTDNLLNFLSAAAIFTVASFSCDAAALRRIARFIIAACWAAFAYGILQIINNYLLPGADPLFWTNFFGRRIFGTSANPNFFADFCLFALILIAALYAHTRKKSLLALAAMGLINIFFTESKGAWLALGVSAVLFALAYLKYFAAAGGHKFRIVAVAAALLLLTAIAAGVYGVKRVQSVNFRVSTWGSVLEMARENPLTGVGAGSFFIHYAKYKKPDIFYMEGRHNAQTHHAENLYVEQLAELGLVGFLLFLFAAFYLLKGAARGLKNHEGEDKFLLLGFGGALAAIYIHNFVDISLYLPSTIFFSALFMGGVFNLSYKPQARPAGPQALPAAQTAPPGKTNILFYPAAIALCIFMAVIAGLVFKDFAFMTAPVFGPRPLLFIIYWVFLCAAIAGVFYIFCGVVFKYKKTFCCFILAGASAVIYCAWGGLIAGHYVSVAGALAERGDLNSALVYYTKAVKYEPFNSSLRQFRAMLFTARFDSAKTNKPQEGDAPARLYNDYDRAMENFSAVQKLNPNEPLYYYHLGSLQLAAARKAQDAARQELYQAARQSFLKAMEFDPVLDNIYFQLANIELDNKNPRAAYDWLLKYRQGPPGIKEEAWLKQHQNNEKANMHIESLGATLGIGGAK